MINITDNAVKQLQNMLAERGEGQESGLRIFVETGGCSGMQYGMAIDSAKEGDSVIDKNGVPFYFDAYSLKYLEGSEIDYVDGLTGSGFRIKNPNAVRTCGCGTSFEYSDQAESAQA